MIRLRVSIKGDPMAGFDALQDGLRDMTAAMRAIAAILAGATEDAFAGERDAGMGAGWKPLAKATVESFVTRSRIRRGEHPILQVTGALAASVVTSSDKLHARIGSDAVQARIQNFGGRAGRGLRTQIPARQFIGIGPQHYGEIEAEVVKSLEASLKAAGLNSSVSSVVP